MAGLFPNEGELTTLAEFLANGEDWNLCLFVSNITPAETDVAATYTAIEAAFTGYARKPLLRQVGAGHWAAPTSGSPSGSWSAETAVAKSTYATQTWTNTGSTVTVYGYFYLGATSGKLIFCELFPSAYTLNTGDSLSVVPPFESC